MTNQERTEKYFRALGWKPKDQNKLCWFDSGGNLTQSLPNICENEPEFQGHVGKVMEENELFLEVRYFDDIPYACWCKQVASGVPGMDDVFHMEVVYKCEMTNNLILPAAVDAAIDYLESKQ